MTSHGMHHHHPPSGPSEAPIGVHGMLLVGEAAVYLSHLPMFMAPHNFQVVLQVTLDAEASRRLRDSRARFGGEDLYTVKPEEFSILDLVPADPAEPAARSAFKGDVVRGHFEKGGEVVARGATIHVDDVIHFQELGLADKAPDLEYILFGTDRQFFLAHRITRPPDFDQVLSAKVTGHRFTADELDRERSGVLVTIPERSNTPADRMKPGDNISARGHVVGAHRFLDLRVEILDELYFEDGELRAKATFAPTKEEKAAGFGADS